MGCKDISCLFFSQKQLGWNLGRSASRLCYTLQQCGILHKLSMAFEIHASNSTCIISEYFTPMLLTAAPPKRAGWSTFPKWKSAYLWILNMPGHRILQYEQSPLIAEIQFPLISSALDRTLEEHVVVILFSFLTT